MNKISIRAVPHKFENGSFLLLPATPAERSSLDAFCETIGNRYVTVTINGTRSNKTYDQVKTVFALCSILFQCNYDRKPNSEENQKMYESLLWDYADKEPDLLHPEREVPVHLSKMSKMQAAQFITNIMALIIDNCDLNDRQQIEVKELFQEFKKQTSVGKGNPCDYDSEGNLLSVDEWCERNNVSMASGIDDGTLEIAHIITKSAHPEYRDCVWNFLRLTHYEHLEIQHRKGWKELLSIYPHLIPRVKAAYDMAHELYPFTMTQEFNDVVTDKTSDSVENIQKEEVQELSFDNTVVKKNLTTDDLAEQALSQEDDLNNYDIF